MKVYVTGHRNPDLDSVCSSLAYAELKNRTDADNQYVGVRCGHLSDTVKTQLASVGINPVPYMRDVYPKVSDVMITNSGSLKAQDPVYKLIKEYKGDIPSAIPVFENEKYKGLLTINDISAWFLSDNAKDNPVYSFTSENISQVIPGKVLKKGKENFTASIIAGAAALEELEGQKDSVVVMGFRPEPLEFAIKMQVPAIVVTKTDDIKDFDISSYNGTFIVTELGTAEALRRLRLSVAIKEIMRKDGPALQVNTLFEDAKDLLSNSRVRGLSVFDQDKFVGFVTRRCFLNKPSNKVILVDHNEVGQSIRGVETADVLEIIDHHRLDALKTDVPIFIDAEPVGSTCTIVYQQYLKKNLVPSAETAKVLLTGIVSDTIILKSPTTTQIDKMSAGSLAALCGVFDIQKFGEKLFASSETLANADPEKTINSDFKQYTESGMRFGIGQCEVTTMSDLDAYCQKYITTLENIRKSSGLDWAMLMITDVLTERSILLVTENKNNSKLPYKKLSDYVYDMPHVLSRKKQLLPEIIHTLQI